MTVKYYKLKDFDSRHMFDIYQSYPNGEIPIDKLQEISEEEFNNISPCVKKIKKIIIDGSGMTLDFNPTIRINLN